MVNYFYPRPPRGGRRVAGTAGHIGVGISIHALREEGDVNGMRVLISSSVFLSTPSARRATGTRHSGCTLLSIFLSTPSARRATEVLSLAVEEVLISIHALREEGDANPAHRVPHRKAFLSTPSARRATGW